MGTSAERRPLEEIIDPSWAEALAPVAATIAALGDFLRAEHAAGYRTLPAGEHILRAFRRPLEDVRVLIVGQDPYPTPGHPIGLSFAVDAHVRPLPKSLVNIFRELVDDVGVPMPANGDLGPWAEQGVMLLNRCLTVRAGQPASHHGRGWEEVTQCAIEALARRGGPLVAILWGRPARALAPSLRPVPLIESAHPSPLSAHRGFFGSRPFSRANAALQAQGGDAIEWSLPGIGQ